MKSKAVLSQTEVATILAAARAEAQTNGWAVTIVVADDGGHPLALERLDGCAPIASYIASEKARSAALGRRETKGYEDMVNGGRSAFLSAPVVCSLEGGVPGDPEERAVSGSQRPEGDHRRGVTRRGR